MAHSHSHRARLRRSRRPDTGDLVLLPRDERNRELDRQAQRRRRIERRELQKAQGPREVVVRIPGVGPGVRGQTKGAIYVRPPSAGAYSRWVWEAEARRIAREALEGSVR